MNSSKTKPAEAGTTAILDADIQALGKEAQAVAAKMAGLRAELGKVIVGQEAVIERLLIALLANGHVLLEGVPGLAKTLMVKSLAACLEANFSRIQFTPDLLPADIVGTKIYNHQTASFSTKKGPIFAHFILADEINRAPPKVQSALLEAMQERQVTISGDTFMLPSPFLVMATENPLETEGTYRLPEAQVDRFMLKVLIDYPTARQEKEIIARNTAGHIPTVRKLLGPEAIMAMQALVMRLYADDRVTTYVTDLVEATRRPAQFGLQLDGLIDYGASPRASIYLVLGAKARALLAGRGFVTPEDVQAVAHDVLRHRILLSYEAEAEDVTSDAIVDKILARVKVP